MTECGRLLLHHDQSARRTTSARSRPGHFPHLSRFDKRQEIQAHELSQSGYAVKYDLNPKSFESFEFYLNAVEIEENLELRCHYDLKLFEDVTIREWLATLGSIFGDLASDPAREVLDLATLKPSAAASPTTEVFYTQTSTLKAPGPSPYAASNSAPQPLPKTLNPLGGSLMQEPALLHAMLPLWQRVLDVSEVLPDDDFFALGGHSILAAQLFALIERELGCTAPLATLYDAATPRALASVLSLGKKVENWQSLVAINRSGDRPPLFLVHSAEGHVLPYRDLAAHLGADQPVFGRQSAGLDGRSPIDGHFEHVAQRYVDEIRQVQPHGPYMLGGYGLGGTLALEMAQQLIASGESVATWRSLRLTTSALSPGPSVAPANPQSFCPQPVFPTPGFCCCGKGSQERSFPSSVARGL